MTLARRAWREGAFSSLRPSRRPSRRAQDPVTDEAARLVRLRAGHRCEGRDPATWPYGCRGVLTIHHRMPVSQGGHSRPSNLLYLCADGHHAWAHNHPINATALGLLVGRREDPAQTPVAIAGVRVLLDDEGNRERAPS